MDSKTIIERAGGIRKLAELLGMSTQAVYAWGDTVPPLRVYQLREKRPEWFESKSRKAARKAT